MKAARVLVFAFASAACSSGSGKIHTPPPDGAATAEIYAPSTGTFSITGSMAIARNLHTATGLPGNAVLIAGGTNAANSYLAGTELYSF